MAVGFAIWYVVREDPLVRDCRDALEAMHDADGAALLRFCPRAEVASENITAEKLTAVLESILAPALASVRPVGEVDSGGANDPITTAWAEQWFETENGDRVALVATLFKTEKDGQAAILHNVLNRAWMIEFTKRHKKPPPRIVLSALEGLRRDRQKLEQIGLTGYWRGYESGFSTWAECEARWSARLAEESSQQPPATDRTPRG